MVEEQLVPRGIHDPKTLEAMQHQTDPLAPEMMDELDKMQKHWK